MTSVSERERPRVGPSPARRFLEHARRRPTLADRETFGDLFRAARQLVPTLSGVAEGDDYGLQPWPVLIDSRRREEFERVGVGLARLVRDLPRRLFGNDPGRVAEVYGLASEAMAAYLLGEPSFLHQTLGRGDFIDTGAGLKCIELNFGNVGGWQHSAFAPLYLEHPEIQAFAAEHGLELTYRDGVRALMRHVVRQSLRCSVPGQRELNLLVIASNAGNTSLGSHPITVYQREYREVLRRHSRRHHGRLEVARSSELDFEDGRLYVAGTRFHSVVDQSEDGPGDELYRGFKAGHLHYFTGLIGLVTGDKRNLALLSEHQDSSLFADHERELIARYVPWTRHLRDGRLDFRGERLPARELLLRRRRDLVIKAGRGFAGQQVVVGRFATSEGWRDQVDAALEGGWIVQEYLAGVPRTFQQGAVGTGDYDVNWGLYVFGDTFGGIFFRMAPIGTTPVLNISRGARIGVVLEAREMAERIERLEPAGTSC